MRITGMWAGLAPLQDRPGELREEVPRRATCRLGRPPKTGAALITLPPNPPGRPAANALPRVDPWGMTPRENEILLMFVQGMSINQIAVKISRSVRTVVHHAERIRTKMSVQTTAQAVYAWHRHYKVVDVAESNKDKQLIASLKKVTTDTSWSKES